MGEPTDGERRFPLQESPERMDLCPLWPQTPIGRSRSGESLMPDDGRKADEDDDREEALAGAGRAQAGDADRMLGEGKDVADVCRELGVRADLLPLAQPVRRAEGRRREAAEGPRAGESTLKRLLADAELEKAALKEIARGNF